MSQRLNAVFAAIVVLAFGLLALAAEAQQPAPNPRIALVIGNATYRDAALATTANDAGLVAQTLQAAGFDVVGARDLDGQSLRTALRDFLQKASAAGPDMQAFVYLSGRAVQYNGDNYFVPVDAQINRDADVPIEAIRIADFTHALAATPGRARIIVLDAARANPYAAQGSPLAPGLALVDPERGELIAFNAAPGTLAGDEEGPYGVYGKTLAGAIRQGGVDIAQAFDQTRVSVNAETQGALLPWSASKLDGPFYVFERAADAPPPALSFAQTERRPISSFSAADAYAAAVERDTLKGYREFLAAYPNSDQARRVRAILAVRREAAYWRRTVGADTPRAYWTYLHTYPKGPHIPDARRRLAMLSAEFEPPADFRPETFADLPPPPPDELVYDDRPIYAFDDFGPPPPPPPVQYVYVEDDDWRDLPPPPPPAEIGVLPVLGVALPIAIGAVAFHNGFHHDGIAPRGQPRLRQAAFAPPPLPGTHQTGSAASAGRRRGRSCGQRGCRQAAKADRAVWPTGRSAGRPRKARRATASSARRRDKPGRRCGSCRPGSHRWPSAQAASDPASGSHSARRRPSGRRAKAPRRRRAASDRCEAIGSRRSGRQASADPSCGRRCAQRAAGPWRQAIADSGSAACGRCCANRSRRSGRQAAARGPLAKRSGSSRRAGRDETRGEGAGSSRGRRGCASRQIAGADSLAEHNQGAHSPTGPCPGSQATARVSKPAGAEAQCRGPAPGRRAARSGSAACGSRSGASGSRPVRASSGSCGDARAGGACGRTASRASSRAAGRPRSRRRRSSTLPRRRSSTLPRRRRRLCRQPFVSRRRQFESSRRSRTRKRAGDRGCRPVRSRWLRGSP